MAIATLGFRVDSKDARRATKDLDGLGLAAGKVGKAVGLVGVAIAAAFSTGALVRGIAEFDRGMSKVAAITGATTSELKAMRDVAKDLGSTTEFSSKQAADGLAFLGMAGFDAAESISALPATLDLATAASLGLGEAADITSNIMSAFGIVAGDASSVTDILAAASSKANTDVSQLGQAMKFVGPVSKGLGISMNDTAAAIGKLSDAGIQGGQAGTTLRKILLSLAAPTKEASDAIEAMGISLADVDPNVVSITDIVDKFADANIDAAAGAKIFGQEAVSGILALTSQAGGLRELTGELKDVDGAAASMAETIRDDLQGDIDGFMSAVSGLIIALGEAGLTAVIRGVVQGVTELVRGVSSVIDTFGSAIGIVSQFGNSMSQLQMATDTTSLAIADEIAQVNALFAAMTPNVRMSEIAALNKLREAEAHLVSADAKQKEARATILSGEAYLGTITKIDDLTVALRAMRTEGDDLDQMPLAMRDAYEETEQSLVNALNRQKEILSLIPETSAEFVAASDMVDKLREAIANAEGGMVDLDGVVVTAANTTDALARIAGNINFDGATSSAQGLANMLGIALSRAISLSATTPMMSDEDAAMGVPVIPNGQQREINRNAVASLLTSTSTTSRGGGGGRSGPSQAQRDAVAEMNELQADAERIMNDLKTPQDEYNDALEQANRLLDAGVLPLEAYNQHVAQLGEEFAAAKLEASGFEPIIEDFKSSVIDAAMGGEDAMERFADSIKRAAIEYALFGSGPLGGAFGGWGGLLGSFAGLFDKGGNIPSGKFGIAGENGPEFIKGPANVTSTRDTAKMMNGGSTSITQNIIVNGATGNAEIKQMVAAGVDEANRRSNKSAPNAVREYTKVYG